MKKFALAVLAFLFLLGGTTQAHVLSSTAYHWWTPVTVSHPADANYCLVGILRVGEGSSWEHMDQHEMWAQQLDDSTGRANCWGDWPRPRAWLAQRINSWKWLETSRQWALCKDYGIVHSITATSYMIFTRLHAGALCGNGIYTVTAGGWVKDRNAAWQGGWIQLGGDHYNWRND